MTGEMRVLVTASNEAEASMICQRLAQAGIGAIAEPASGAGVAWGGGPHTVYVAAERLEAARELLDPGP